MTDVMLSGAIVYGPYGAAIGIFSHMHLAGLISHAILDVDGIAGTETRQVAVLLRYLQFMRDANGVVFAKSDRTEYDLLQLPDHQDH
jgi:hypothetical protein